MWDNQTPLQLLNTFPRVLETEHLEKLQRLIDADKYKNQLIGGYELCGSYAPFCDGCDKEQKYPCAVAYVKFMQANGMDIEIVSEKAADNSCETKVNENSGNRKIRIAVARKKTL